MGLRRETRYRHANFPRGMRLRRASLPWRGIQCRETGLAGQKLREQRRPGKKTLRKPGWFWKSSSGRLDS